MMSTAVDTPDIKHNGSFILAIGRSRHDTAWTNKTFSWAQLIGKLAKPHRTHEPYSEYLKMSKEEQGAIKDIGGFVGGSLKSGRRKAGNVAMRQLITLDADFAQPGLIERCTPYLGCGFAWYSTHKHCPEKPRLRILIPLARPVFPEEYQAVARRMAELIGIDEFDDTTYELNRLMYWPSVSADGEYLWGVEDDQWLDPDEVLARYTDWRDPSQWPESSRVKQTRKATAEKQGDPLAKQGIIGLFCRTYSIQDAIAKYLSDIYSKVEAGEGDRYTYIQGSSVGGLVLYDNGKFAYSHHGTDPISGQLVNAFDLVRIHKFGSRDEEERQDTPVTKLPSYQAMVELAQQDETLKETLGQESLQAARQEFGEAIDTDADMSWMARLDMDKSGRIKATVNNIVMILEQDAALQGVIAYNEFSHRLVLAKDAPWHKVKDHEAGDAWTDEDDSALRHYLEFRYTISSPGKTKDAVAVVMQRNTLHPVRSYLDGLAWDGVPRVESLLIDYMGAEDCEYTRAVTRKMLAGAVGRIYRPGLKFDYMLILVGPQGSNKSTLIGKLGGRWYSDSLYTISGKEAYELLQGKWIIEMGEMAATKKAEIESIKQFVSKQEDLFRQAYGHHTSEFPRQCVFFGTSNDSECLRDRTGNRRFWPVDIRVTRPGKDVWKDLTKTEIDQIWAEASQIYKAGEPLYLEQGLEHEALTRQEAHTEESSKAGMILEYLDKLLPEDWEGYDIDARRQYIHGGEGLRLMDEGVNRRTRVCALEIWVELFWGDPKNFKMADAREINDVLRKTAGWVQYKPGVGKLRFGRLYGLQRAFIRGDDRQHQ